MRDLVLNLHMIFGISIVFLSFIILNSTNDKLTKLKVLSAITAAISWLLMVPAAILYITFYPATKTLVKAGSWPWAHSILMETKEHWGILIPFIATVAALLVFDNKIKESKKWWQLLIVLSILIAIMGRIIKIGALK